MSDLTKVEVDAILETIFTLCCPKCHSENIRVRISTDGIRDCVRCYDCDFEGSVKSSGDC